MLLFLLSPQACDRDVKVKSLFIEKCVLRISELSHENGGDKKGGQPFRIKSLGLLYFLRASVDQGDIFREFCLLKSVKMGKRRGGFRGGNASRFL